MQRGNRGSGRRGRGRRINTQTSTDANANTVGHTREKNWTEGETTKLLNAAQQVQVMYGRKDLKFTSQEFTKIHETFLSYGDVDRGIESLKNRLKTLRAEFGNFHELMSKSGWNWDGRNHVPMAPGPRAWEELIAINKKKWQYYPSKRFPWYVQFMEMLGTSAMTGDYSIGTLNSSMSGTGSSDTAPDVNRENYNFDEMRNQVEETVQQAFEGHQPSANDGEGSGPCRQGSTDTGATRNRSGSSNKRKSTDRPPESSRSQRAKNSVSINRATQQSLVHHVGELVKTTKALVEQNEQFIRIQQGRFTIPQEIVEKLRSFNLTSKERKTMMHALSNTVDQQIFMESDLTEQVEFIDENISGFLQRFIRNMAPPPN